MLLFLPPGNVMQCLFGQCMVTFCHTIHCNVWCGKKWRGKTLSRGQNLEIRKWKRQFISETSKRTKWYTAASKELLQSPKIGEIKHTLEDQLQNQKIESVNSYQNPQRETKWYTATEKEPPQTKMLGGKWQMKAHLNYYLLTKWNRQRICEPCIFLYYLVWYVQPGTTKSSEVRTCHLIFSQIMLLHTLYKC